MHRFLLAGIADQYVLVNFKMATAVFSGGDKQFHANGSSFTGPSVTVCFADTENYIVINASLNEIEALTQ